jgi:hypothetical protein
VLKLHNLAETLEAPALLWNVLAWYWGMSFMGMAPSYLEYMKSDAPSIDAAFNDPNNEDINHVLGYPRRLTIKERFDRAVNFYVYCFHKGRSTSINPPWDYPPDVDTLIAQRQRMEGRAQKPDEIIESTVNSILDNEDYRNLWNAGGKVKREQRAKDYNQRVLEALDYVRAEIVPRLTLSKDQLSDEGFLDVGCLPEDYDPTPDQMDEVMPQEVQWEKLGDCYKRKVLHGSEQVEEIVAYGVIGKYYTAGHNLELNMYDEDRKRELSYAHNATVRTWKQLMEVNKDV